MAGLLCRYSPHRLRASERPAVLVEIGIDVKGARSKSVEEFRSVEFDLVVTVCDQAAGECPVRVGRGRRLHIGFPDPAKAAGTEEIAVYLEAKKLLDADDEALRLIEKQARLQQVVEAK